MSYHVTVTIDPNNVPETIQPCVHWLWKLPTNEHIANDGLMESAALELLLRLKHTEYLHNLRLV